MSSKQATPTEQKSEPQAEPKAKKSKAKFDSPKLVHIVVSSSEPLSVQQIAEKAGIEVTGALSTRLSFLAKGGKIAASVGEPNFRRYGAPGSRPSQLPKQKKANKTSAKQPAKKTVPRKTDAKAQRARGGQPRTSNGQTAPVTSRIDPSITSG